MKSDDGGSAFPNMGEIFIDGPQGRMPQSAWGMEGERGMTLRDYFAGQALIGLLVMPGEYGDEARNHPDKCAEWSYAQADAMLAERKRKKESQ